tara:strand:- start:1369 stop:2061 length:693 start_codon:yes stop_codon:yes gene_type:complete
MQNDIVQDIAVLLSYTMQDLPDVEPLKCPIEEVKKDDLIIKNTMYKTAKLRKVHLELAELKGLKILHCVFFPDPNYNLPIFGCDIVATEKTVTAAIVDISPVKGYDNWDDIREISNEYNFKGKRPLPLWGDDVFSPYCKFTRLSEDIDTANFYCLVMQYLRIYLLEVNKCERDTDWVKTMLRFDDQIYYCDQQRKNDKTRGILEKLFDKDFATNYIDNVLFDKPIMRVAL